MEVLFLPLELIGTISFAISGAMVGLRKNMDVFGVCILGLITAVGGGVLRDILLGALPPVTFLQPTYAIVAIVTSIIIFIPAVRRTLMANQRKYDLLMLWADSIGLGVFTVYGVSTALTHSVNLFLALFVGVCTGVGGGVLRDTLAGLTPYIFVKHIYACAAIVGAVACIALWPLCGKAISMGIGIAIIVTIRMLAAHFRWSLPKANAAQ
ncbi:MAG: TRIC cation channel family protein [Oscillospiraceae bacterium]|nr:TRIC cation channel family protein [Oscillospiraceae bacterium]